MVADVVSNGNQACELGVMGVQFGGDVDKFAHLFHSGAYSHTNAPGMGLVVDTKCALIYSRLIPAAHPVKSYRYRRRH